MKSAVNCGMKVYVLSQWPRTNHSSTRDAASDTTIYLVLIDIMETMISYILFGTHIYVYLYCRVHMLQLDPKPAQ